MNRDISATDLERGFTSIHAGYISKISSYLTDTQLAGAKSAAIKMRTSLDGNDRPLKLLVAYGGGKDSSYTVAFIRLVQLLILRDTGRTFFLRVATNRHAGMPPAVMQNIDRCYQALGIDHDSLCEAFLIDGSVIRPFSVALALPGELAARNRQDILMTAHRTRADARPTFCNACNLSMVSSFGLAAAHEGGVDIIVTGDSRYEQRSYLLWVNRLSKELGLPVARDSGFRGILKTIDQISSRYFASIHDNQKDLEERVVYTAVSSKLKFFSIYEDTSYDAGSHWALLTDCLKFEFDELAFSFTESDCANPLLMAHLRGLKCEHVYARSYDEGIVEYVNFAINLMHEKKFPDSLICLVRDRYATRVGREYMRKLATAYAWSAYGLSETHLICMTYSPFVKQGENLRLFLEREYPDYLRFESDLRRLLSGRRSQAGNLTDPNLIDTLERMSGLKLDQMQHLYADTAAKECLSQGKIDIIQHVLERDPHKSLIETRHHPDGPVVVEMISGR
ncbi:hypothetical protein AAC691_13890 [Nguyenibacter vanlangensis]|uniref:PqqD family protein n=1 Tax=Nguyenibacter vanlangensis TaxID=1216886 RepID=A0ABZ3D0W2_9PROT